MRTLLAILSLVSLVFAGPGCSNEDAEGDSQHKQNTGGENAGGASGGAGGLGGALVSPIRTIEMRNPFGGPSDNLLADGDFELSTFEGGGPLAWRAIRGGSLVTIPVETGGLCQSGVHCAVLEPETSLFAMGTSAPGGRSQSASVLVKVPEGLCEKVEVILYACPSYAAVLALEGAAASDPGWCRYSGNLTPIGTGVCLSVSAVLQPGERAIVDSGSLLELADDSAGSGQLERRAISSDALRRLQHAKRVLGTSGPERAFQGSLR